MKVKIGFADLIRIMLGTLLFLISLPLAAQNVLTLEQSMEIAMENSPDIKRLELSVERSRQMLNSQEASLKTQFNLSLTPIDYNRGRTFNDFFAVWNNSETLRSLGTFRVSQPIKWTDGTIELINTFSWQDSYSEFNDVSSTTFSNNLYLSIDQPIFTYNRTKLALRELELDLENTSLNYAIQKLALERNVTQAFYNVYYFRMSLQIATEEYENQKNSYTIIKNKVDAGLAAQEELYQAELNLMTSESNQQNQQVVLDNGLDSFKRLIGIPILNEINILTDISHNRVDIDLQKAMEHGMEHRMELRQRQIDIETSQFSITQAQAINEFKGNIGLSIGLIGTDEAFNNIYDVPTQNQRASISFDIPLWDWGFKKSRVKAAEASVGMNEVDLETQKTDIMIGIRQVYRNLQNLQNQIEIARQNEKNAQLTYDINLMRYENGDLTSMDLNLFQTQLSEKKIGLVKALIDYKVELLNMKIQSLWDFTQNMSVVPDITID